MSASFIDLIVRISSALIEAEAMLSERERTRRRWDEFGYEYDEAELPPSPEDLIPPDRAALTDIASSALRIRDMYDNLGPGA